MRTTEAAFPLVSGTLNTLRLGLVFVCALMGIALFAAAPARADLRVCNQTTNPVSIALGYRADRGWQSEGWWVAPPEKCATVFQGDLNSVGSSYFYLFAADDIGGGAWDGQVYMCTRDETFTIFGVEDCLARGYERTGFFEVDTENNSDWMLQLTEGEPGDLPAGDIPDETVPLEGDLPPADETEPSMDTQ
jgi:uncharacterized membrane protein